MSAPGVRRADVRLWRVVEPDGRTQLYDDPVMVDRALIASQWRHRGAAPLVECIRVSAS